MLQSGPGPYGPSLTTPLGIVVTKIQPINVASSSVKETIESIILDFNDTWCYYLKLDELNFLHKYIFNETTWKSIKKKISFLASLAP